MVLFWSANYIVGKIALREFPPLLAGSLRIILAGLFIAAGLRVEPAGRASGPGRTRRSCSVGLLGLFGVTLNQLFFMIGLSRTSVVHSALIIAMTPIFVLAIAAAIGQERITARKAGGHGGRARRRRHAERLPTAASRRGDLTWPGDFFIFLAGLTLRAVHRARQARHQAPQQRSR